MLVSNTENSFFVKGNRKFCNQLEAIMHKADIVIIVIFDIDNPEKTVIETNAKTEALEEILEAWISSQIGQGKDESKRKEKNEYKIMIQLDLSDDTFYTTSDTGNKSLTAGIIVAVFNKLDKVKIRNLS